MRELVGSAGGHIPVGKPMYFAALEIACWDIIGKYLDMPICNLIGGKCREKIPFDAIVYYRHTGDGGVCSESTSVDIVKHISDSIYRYEIMASNVRVASTN